MIEYDLCFNVDQDIADKRFVIYGASESGKFLYRYLEKEFRAIPSIFVDRDVRGNIKIDERDVNEVMVYAPDWCLTNEDAYDYVVLATSSVHAKRAMTDTLLSYQVPSDAILTVTPMLRKISDGCVIEQHTVQQNDVQELLTAYYNGNITSREMKYLCGNLDNYLAEWKIDDKQQKLVDKIRKSYLWNLEYVSALVLEALYLGTELPQFLNEFIYERFISHGNLEEAVMCSLRAYLEIMNRTIDVPRDYYTKMRKRFAYLADQVYPKREFPPREKSDSKRLAITFGFMLKKEYAPLQIAYRISQYFCEQGWEVVIFDENIMCDFTEYQEEHHQLFDGFASIIYNKGSSITDKCRSFVYRIEQYQPSVIMDLTDSGSLSSYYLRKLFPIVAQPCTETYAMDADSYIAPFPNKLVNEYKILSKESVYKAKDGLYLPNSECVDEDEINEPCLDQKKVIVTVGFRLQHDLTEECLVKMCQFLKENDCIWLLVGEYNGVWIKQNHPELLSSKKIILWGYEKKLPNLYKKCDIYFNPIRKGGGWSIGLAFMKGMPVVCSVLSDDGSNWVGEELSIDGGYDELIATLTRLLYDCEYYQEFCEKGKERYKILCMNADGPRQVFEICMETMLKSRLS